MLAPPRILIVDDDPLARRAFEDVYRHGGFEPLSVPGVAAALDALGRAAFDVCLVDVSLPERSGLTFLEGLRGRLEAGRTALLGTTARREPQWLPAAFAAGADDFVWKPVTSGELLVRSRVALERRRARSPLQDLNRGVRRELTVLFCDVRGYTAVSAELDPESVVDVLNSIFDRVVAQVHSHGGLVDKFLGDGLLACFGVSGSDEGKELAAVRAGVAMVAAAEAHSRESLVLQGRRLTVGVGIATGMAVIAAVGAQVQRQMTAIGDTVNLAARLEGIAAEGEVMICPTTHARVASRVETGQGRLALLKGISPPPTVYPVLRVH